MRFLSVCAGIEAASVAWEPLGWKAAAFSEIDAFPSAVLAAHYPHTPNLGDMTKFQEWPDLADVSLLVGGTPCQSFSVAGLRRGLDDPRGNLMLVYGAIARRYRPRWLVWENVPGVLSSNGGRDFGTFLGMLGECGYGYAYRVLDAQYFGLAQRRKRVFVVGYLGDWRPAAAVFLERSGLRGDLAPRREARKNTARTLASRTRGGAGFKADVAYTLEARNKTQAVAFDTTQVTSPVNFSNPQPGDPCHPLAAKGHAPAVAFTEMPTHAHAQEAGPVEALRALRDAVDEETLAKWSLGILAAFWPAEVLQSGLHGGGLRRSPQPQRGLVNVTLSRAKVGSAWTVRDLWEAGCDGCPPSGWQPSEQLARELGAYLSKLPYSPSPAQRFLHAMWQAAEGARVLREALSAVQEARRSAIGEGQSAHGRTAVRRLVVEECEALQGFPRGYTLITYRRKPAADGPRYKALGNSMAVPVMRWIGERIMRVERVMKEPSR